MGPRVLKRPAAAAAAAKHSINIKTEPAGEPEPAAVVAPPPLPWTPAAASAKKQNNKSASKAPRGRKPAAAPKGPDVNAVKDLPSLLDYLEESSEVDSIRLEQREEKLRRKLQDREDALRRQTDALRQECEEREARAHAQHEEYKKELEEREERIRAELHRREEELRAQLAGAQWPAQWRQALMVEVEKRAVAEGQVYICREKARALSVPQVPVGSSRSSPAVPERQSKRRRLSVGDREEVQAFQDMVEFAAEDFQDMSVEYAAEAPQPSFVLRAHPSES